VEEVGQAAEPVCGCLRRKSFATLSTVTGEPARRAPGIDIKAKRLDAELVNEYLGLEDLLSVLETSEKGT